MRAEWRCLRVAGIIPFVVIASLTAPLAEAGISVFAISTFDTDYLLVKEDASAEERHRRLAAGRTFDHEMNEKPYFFRQEQQLVMPPPSAFLARGSASPPRPAGSALSPTAVLELSSGCCCLECTPLLRQDACKGRYNRKLPVLFRHLLARKEQVIRWQSEADADLTALARFVYSTLKVQIEKVPPRSRRQAFCISKRW